MTQPDFQPFETDPQLGQLYVSVADVELAYTNAARIVRDPGFAHLSTVTYEGAAHPLIIAGYAIGRDMSVTFWSSERAAHVPYVTRRAGSCAMILTLDDRKLNRPTESDAGYIRMLKIDCEPVSPDKIAEQLVSFNDARRHAGIGERPIEQFNDSRAPRQLFVAHPSSEGGITYPISEVYANGEWAKEGHYPLNANAIWQRADQLRAA